ncbi:hypothetical protein OG589_37090 [Sphaerisporangium sp. NBC_01403]|uniref:hypothetical protein n=1 Tax=Sphaerisporangium sp. NBC_01403 TaxID=2903599 RepID=UPI0032559323
MTVTRRQALGLFGIRVGGDADPAAGRSGRPSFGSCGDVILVLRCRNRISSIREADHGGNDR